MSVLLRKKTIAGILAIFLLIIASGGCRPAKVKPLEKLKPPEKEKKEKPEVKNETIKITLYFADKEAEYLVPEVRKIPETEKVAEAAVREIIKGPGQSGHLKTIPEGTKLRNVAIKEGLAYVNFSQELVNKHPGGSAAETMTIYSVVNTLTQFPEIEKVQFLVEGKKIETIAGHYDTSQPFERREDLIKE